MQTYRAEQEALLEALRAARAARLARAQALAEFLDAQGTDEATAREYLAVVGWTAEHAIANHVAELERQRLEAERQDLALKQFIDAMHTDEQDATPRRPARRSRGPR